MYDKEEIRKLFERDAFTKKEIKRTENVSYKAPPRRTFLQDLKLTSGTYSRDSIPKLLGSIFVHFLNPALIWIQNVSAILGVRSPYSIPFSSPIWLSQLTSPSSPSQTVFLRRHSLHPSPNLYPAPLCPHRLAKRLLFHRRSTRRPARRDSRPPLRLCRSPPCPTGNSIDMSGYSFGGALGRTTHPLRTSVFHKMTYCCRTL